MGNFFWGLFAFLIRVMATVALSFAAADGVGRVWYSIQPTEDWYVVNGFEIMPPGGQDGQIVRIYRQVPKDVGVIDVRRTVEVHQDLGTTTRQHCHSFIETSVVRSPYPTYEIPLSEFIDCDWKRLEGRTITLLATWLIPLPFDVFKRIAHRSVPLYVFKGKLYPMSTE
jgi:hypothetical protein